jgi:hypothetical protein
LQNGIFISFIEIEESWGLGVLDGLAVEGGIDN